MSTLDRRALLDALLVERFGTPMFAPRERSLAAASAELEPDVCLGCDTVVESLDLPCPTCSTRRQQAVRVRSA